MELYIHIHCCFFKIQLSPYLFDFNVHPLRLFHTVVALTLGRGRDAAAVIAAAAKLGDVHKAVVGEVDDLDVGVAALVIVGGRGLLEPVGAGGLRSNSQKAYTRTHESGRLIRHKGNITSNG